MATEKSAKLVPNIEYFTWFALRAGMVLAIKTPEKAVLTY